MENAEAGGNRGSIRKAIFSAPETAEGAPEEALGGAPETAIEDSAAGNAEDLQRGLGGAGLLMPEMPEGLEMPGDLPGKEGKNSFPEAELAQLAAEAPKNSDEIMEFSQLAEMPDTEMRPLAADGSTEKKMGKVAVDLMGDVIDKATERELQGKINELKNDPFELSNYRDTEMAESLRSNFGRIFGNDTGGAA